MANQVELSRLLESPNETLAIEYKSWLSISENAGKATIAKAAIGLANHGGGIIVLGMRGDNQTGGALTSQPRPEGLRRYNQDDINGAINRYADPTINCELLFQRHTLTGTEHAFVVIPGNFATPVMSVRGCDGVIAAQRCYIRKPGPKTEEPFTSEEWRSLIDRCVRSGRENLLDAIRHIVQGNAGAAPKPDALSVVKGFAAETLERWQKLVAKLPKGNPALMEHGYRQLTFQIENVESAPNLVELKRRMSLAEQVRLTGWHPFLNLDREPFRPKIVNDVIEAWLGGDSDKRHLDDAAHCDFWRATADGRLSMLRGFEEDTGEKRPPGKAFDITLPVWRIAEPLLHVARLARQFGDTPSVTMLCRYKGLSDRSLVSINDHRTMYGTYKSADDESQFALTATVSEIEDNLAELLYPHLRKLYEKFDFFELPRQLVIEELERLRKGRY